MTDTTAIEKVSEVIETLDNLHGALQLPMPAAIHIEQMKLHLPELRDKLIAAYIGITGENPWA